VMRGSIKKRRWFRLKRLLIEATLEALLKNPS